MKKIIGLILTLVCLQASAQYDSTRVWQSVNGDGFIWKNGQFNGALIFPTDTPHLKTAQRAIGFKGTTPYYWTGTKWNSFGGAGGVGTLTNFIAGNMTPFFTTNVADPTGAASLTFTLSPSAAYTIWGNNGGSTAAPAYFTPVLASNLFSNQGTTTTVLHGNASGPPSWGQVSAADLNLTGTQSVRITGSAIALHNDQTTPDTFYVYGTDSTAARGWQPSQPSRLTSPQDGDNIVIQNDATGRAFYVNVTTTPLTGLFGPATVIDLGNLNYLVTYPAYKINGVLYPAGAQTITLPVGSASPGEGRIDWIVLNASGAASIQGLNSATPTAPEQDEQSNIYLSFVLINEDDTVPATPSLDVQVYDENTGPPGEFTVSSTGTITYNANNATNLLKGTKNIAITAMNTTGHLLLTNTDTLTKTDYTYLIIPIRVDATINAASNYTVQLGLGTTFSNAIQVTVWAAPTFKTASATYKYVSIPMSEFTGNPKFKIIRFNRTGTGGTVNLKLDDIKLQKVGFTSSDDGTALIGGFVRNDSLYGTRKNGTNVFMGIVGSAAASTNVNSFSTKPNRISTVKHTSFGLSSIINGNIVNYISEGVGHVFAAGNIPVAYVSSNQGKSYARNALPLTGIPSIGTAAITNMGGGVVGSNLWVVGTDYPKADEAQATTLWYWKTTNGTTWTNPVQILYDTTTYDLLTAYGNVRQAGSRIGFMAYGTRSGGTSVVCFIYSTDSGTSWNLVEVRTGNLTTNFVDETDWIETSTNNLIAISRREDHDPVLSYSADNGSTWSDGGTLTIATNKGFTDRWHAPYLYMEGSEVFCLFSDRRKWNIPQISVTSNYTSAATWNASDVRIVGTSIIQSGWGAYDFGYCSTIGTGENRMLVMYDTSPNSVDPLDLANNYTDIVTSPLPLTQRPKFLGRSVNEHFLGGGNATENANTLRFDRIHTRVDNVAMLSADSSFLTIKQDGWYDITGTIRLTFTAFGALSLLNMATYMPGEDTSDLSHTILQAGHQGLNTTTSTPFLTLTGCYYLVKGQIIKFRVNVDADEDLNLTEYPSFSVMRREDNSELVSGTNINQTVYDTTAADQVLRDTVGAHNTRLIALENGAGAGSYVPTTTTVNGHALSSNVTVTKSDVSLGNVDNTSDATKNSATVTLTNKTLTSPIINVTSDATGDMYYRNSGGAFTRLPIGPNGQTLHIVSGLPAWRDTAAGGGGSASGNYGNLQLNRNGVFVGTDSIQVKSGFQFLKGMKLEINNVYGPGYLDGSDAALVVDEGAMDNVMSLFGNGNLRFRVSRLGYVAVNRAIVSGINFISQAGIDGNIAIAARAHSSSQSENILEVQDDAGNEVAGNNAAGQGFFKNTTAPGASLTDGVILFAADVAASSELKVRDEAGNVTVLSPHNFTGIPQGKSNPMAWSFYSERDGKYINVDMYKLAELVEKLTGQKLIYTGSINEKPNEKNK